MVIDPQLPRASWPIGLITQTVPAPDGRVRTVEVKVGDHSYTRPVSRIVSLPKLPKVLATSLLCYCADFIRKNLGAAVKKASTTWTLPPALRVVCSVCPAQFTRSWESFESYSS